LSSGQENGEFADWENPESKPTAQQQEQKENVQKADNPRPDQAGVRFAADDEEIDPLDDSRRLSQAGGLPSEELSPEAHEQIRSLAMSLQKSRLQENRMANFAYETVSMPTSRVCGMLSISLDRADRHCPRSHREIVRRPARHAAP
jgi:hypothetical protein